MGQKGMVARWQLLALGVGPSAIKYRMAIGRLHPSDYVGVYAVGVPAVTPHARAYAAVLACGPGAVLSHGSAAVLWGIYRHWRHPLEVTARSRRRHRNLRVHHAKLAEDDRTVQHDIPVTSAARTVYDLADRLGGKRLARVIPDLRRARYLYLPDLIGLLDRHPGTRATRLLRPHTEHPERNPTRSTLEAKFLAFVERYDLPVPQVNEFVCGFEIDAYYPEHRLVVELDGYEYHKDRDQFERDRKRDAILLATENIPTVRVTEERLDNEPGPEAERLRQILTDRHRP